MKARIITEEKDFTPSYYRSYAKREIGTTRLDQEIADSNQKTSEFRDRDPEEEFYIETPIGDLGSSRSSDGVEFQTAFRTSAQVITAARTASQNPIVKDIYDQHCNEAMSFHTDDAEDPVKLVQDISQLKEMGIESEEWIKNTQKAYRRALYKLRLKERGWYQFKRFMVDGRLYFEKVYGDDVKGEVIRYNFISPYNIVKIKDPIKGAYYYLYDETRERWALSQYYNNAATFMQTAVDIHMGTYENGDQVDLEKVKLIPVEYVICVENDERLGNYPVSDLSFALKILNQYEMLQDSLVVQRISNAPERLVYTIGLGDNRGAKGEQVLKRVHDRMSQEARIDRYTGKAVDQKSIASTVERIVIPDYGDGRASKVTALPRASNLNAVEDLKLMHERLISALRSPRGRQGISTDAVVSIGGGDEIQREEIAYAKYIQRKRCLYDELIWEATYAEMVYDNLVKTPTEFQKYRNAMHLDYANSNYYERMIELEQLSKQAAIYSMYEQFIESGQFTDYQIKRLVFGTTEEDYMEKFDYEEDIVRIENDRLKKNFDILMDTAEMKYQLAVAENPEYRLQEMDIQQNLELQRAKYKEGGPSNG